VLLITVSIPFVKDGAPAGSWTLGPWNITVTYDGLVIFWNVMVKSSLSMLCMILLVATTPFPALLKGFEGLRCPRVILLILSFMYRYLFLFHNVFMRMVRAKNCRPPSENKIREFKALAGIIGVLFIRAYEKAERVYLAMCSRGFDGTFIREPLRPPKPKDVALVAAFILCLGIGRMAGGYR
jgi:cobalt/nickel transport system permease protein